MENIITVSIGLGLVISLFFSELLGLAAGGMVVPGYIAVYFDRPMVIIITIAIGYLTYFIVHALGTVIIIYGRRRTVMMILVGFILGWMIRSIGVVPVGSATIDINIVGYIIPGLIAIWMDRQGIIETVTTLLTSSIIVRLLLLLIFGGELMQ